MVVDYFTRVKLVDGYGNLRTINDPNQLKAVAGGECTTNRVQPTCLSARVGKVPFVRIEYSDTDKLSFCISY